MHHQRESGSIRLPKEEAIQKALDDVHLSEAIPKLPAGKKVLSIRGEDQTFLVGQTPIAMSGTCCTA